MFDKILDYTRIGLFIILSITCLMLFDAWQKEHAVADQATEAATATTTPANDRFVPNAATAPAPTTTAVPAIAAATPPSTVETGQLIKVTTDVLSINIDTLGGDIVESNLLAYPESLGSKTPFNLMTNNKDNRYIAESGLLSAAGPDTSEHQALYTTESTNYQLEPGQENLVVKLEWQNPEKNLTVQKTYTFTRGSYEVAVGYQIINNSNTVWNGNLYTQLARMDTPPVGNTGFISLATYFGAAVSSPDKPFEKISFKSMREANLDKQIKGGWAAMIQHYFISAWVPDANLNANYYTRVLKNGLYTVGILSPTLSVQPGETATTATKLYTGPALADQLQHVSPHLNLTIDYGWFWFISVAILWMMQKIYDVVGNWGWSIVLVTVIIKILFYQLSAKSYRSMAAMKRVQPRMEALKERYKDDKEKLTKAMMELYREEKVNPMSGCLPILIQIPVFIALYWVLVESVQLRQSPFIFWIHDLTQHDPYYVLPVMMGISMFIQQRLNPPPPDPMQAKIMMLMPIVFTAMFANFPAGLMLYWFVNNTLSVLQQWYIMRQINPASK